MRAQHMIKKVVYDLVRSDTDDFDTQLDASEDSCPEQTNRSLESNGTDAIDKNLGGGESKRENNAMDMFISWSKNSRETGRAFHAMPHGDVGRTRTCAQPTSSSFRERNHPATSRSKQDSAISTGNNCSTTAVCAATETDITLSPSYEATSSGLHFSSGSSILQLRSNEDATEDFQGLSPLSSEEKANVKHARRRAKRSVHSAKQMVLSKRIHFRLSLEPQTPEIMSPIQATRLRFTPVAHLSSTPFPKKKGRGCQRKREFFC